MIRIPSGAARARHQHGLVPDQARHRHRKDSQNAVNRLCLESGWRNAQRQIHRHVGHSLFHDSALFIVESAKTRPADRCSLEPPCTPPAAGPSLSCARVRPGAKPGQTSPGSRFLFPDSFRDNAPKTAALPRRERVDTGDTIAVPRHLCRQKAFPPADIQNRVARPRQRDRGRASGVFRG